VSQVRLHDGEEGVDIGPVLAGAPVIHDHQDVDGGDQRSVVPLHEPVRQHDPLVNVDVLVKIGRYVSYRNGTERTDMVLHYYGTVPYCYGTLKLNGTATLNGTAYCNGTRRT
jgi:hypothetical protein